MSTDYIKNFYSNLHFPGRYTQKDLEFYEREGVDVNVYLREINRVMKDKLEVLDIGCGTGLVSNTFATLYPDSSFTGVDFSNSIDYAKKISKENKLTNTKWVKEDFLKVKLNKKYDVVICCGVLHHIPQYQEALDKLKRLLKPGGTLMIALYNPLGKILKHVKKINYNSPTLFEDQENNPFELSFTKQAVLNMCSDLTFHRVEPSWCNHFVNFLALFNSSNGGLAIYTFTND
jgi:2-polyprenyl-3-methyl-5-hydroxy-6-metoxy-1,4-benzoquinol methylase